MEASADGSRARRTWLLADDEAREGPALAVWGDEPLPEWIQSSQIKEILKQDAKDKVCQDKEPGVYKPIGPIDLNRTAGPAVLWGLVTLVGLTYFLAALPVVGTYIARCPAEERSNNFATYPEILLWIIFFMPLTVMILVAQWKTMTYLCVPMVQQIRHDRAEEGTPWRFEYWFAFNSVMTVFNLLDQMTNALFTAKTWATRHCYGYQFIQNIWSETVSQSLAARILMLDKVGLDFAEFAAAAYFIQLVVQPVVALAFSAPVLWQSRRSPGEDHRRGLPVDYDIVMDRSAHVATYKTSSDDSFNPEDRTTHRDAAAVLAEVNRMEAVGALDMAYRTALCKHLAHDLKVQLRAHSLSHEDRAEHVYKCLDECLEIAIAATGRGVARFCLRGLLQNAVQVNLQVSMAAISKTVLKGGMDTFNMFSIGITIVSMFGDVPDIMAVFNFARNIAKKVDVHVREHEQLEARLASKVNTLRWRVIRLQIYAVLYGLLAALALMKLGSAFFCKYGTWNLTSLDKNWGCADVPEDYNATVCPVGEYLCK